MIRPRKFSNDVENISRTKARVTLPHRSVTRRSTLNPRANFVPNLFSNINRQIIARVTNCMRIHANNARLIRRKIAKTERGNRVLGGDIQVTTCLSTRHNNRTVVKRFIRCALDRVLRNGELQRAARAPRTSQVENINVIGQRR